MTPAGNGQLLGWLGGFGMVVRVGVEGTGSYGAGLARYLRRVLRDQRISRSAINGSRG